MSLFDDDFFCTKRMERSWLQMQQKGQQPPKVRSSRNRNTRLILISAAAGAAVMLLLLLVFRPFGNPVANPSGVLQKDTQRQISDSVVHAAEKIRPSVVSVTSLNKKKKDDVAEASGVGSGVVFERSDDKVHIVTNNHVIEGGNEFEVAIEHGEKKKAVVIGKDHISDLAVLETDGGGFSSIAEFGESNQVKTGETVIAVGNPLGLGEAPSVTRGIISSPKRTIPVSLARDGVPDWEMEVIQTDAAINQGNSGGALVDLDGKVIGINSLKVSDTGVEGVGFALPIDDVKPILNSLLDEEHKVKRPFLGVATQQLQSVSGSSVLKLPKEIQTGLIVIEASGPAKAGGLKSRDVIVEMDGKRINTTVEMRKYLYLQKHIGDPMEVMFYRDGKKQTTTVQLSESGEAK